MRVRRSFNHNAETQKRLKKIAFDTSYGAGAYFDKHKQRYVRYSDMLKSFVNVPLDAKCIKMVILVKNNMMVGIKYEKILFNCMSIAVFIMLLFIH
jgi:hypothetical protein